MERLSLRARLAIGFGAVIGLMVLADLAAMVGHEHSRAAFARYLDREDRISDISVNSQAAMEKARRYEKEFLLKVRLLPYDEARSRYATLVTDQVETVRANMAAIRVLGGSPDLARITREVDGAAAQYVQGFLETVELYGRLGRAGTGLQGRFTASARELELALAASGSHRLMADLLTMRREEKNFLLRGLQRHAIATFDAGARLQSGLAALPADRAEAVRPHLAEYIAAFREYRAVAARIDATAGDYLQAVNRMEPRLNELRTMSDDALADTRAAVGAAQQNMTLAVFGGGIATLLLGALIARLITRSVRRSIDASVDLAGELAAGNWAARLPALPAGHEFGALSGAMNAMAHELQQARLRDHARTAELENLNRMLRLLSRCNEIVGRAGSEEELLAALARLFADDGAWLDAHLTLGEYGGDSGVALPLRYRGEYLGELRLRACDPAGVETQEAALLHELADDLGFGIGSMREAARRQAAELALEQQANFDRDTGLPSRALFDVRVQQAARPVAVLVVGLDRLRQLVDSEGLDAGNLLLRHVGAALTAELPAGATVARLHGNELAIVVPIGDGDVLALAGRLLPAVQKPLALPRGEVSTTASIGIALSPKDGLDAADLLRAAGAAMGSAAAQGGNRLGFYAPEMNERISDLFALEADLRQALANGELCVHYQPRAILASGAIVGAEALVRWQHPVRGLLAPGEFIPVAEMCGLIAPLGTWVMREVCRQQRAWRDAGLPSLAVAVNVSPSQFRDQDLAALVRQSLDEFGLPASCIELEIVESAVMRDIEHAAQRLQALKATGVTLSLDDFGTGHSSLSRLRELPFDHLKIDQSFVRNLTTDPADAAICQSIIALAHNLRLTVIAEGVETEGQANYLRLSHCDQMQGFHFARPMPADELGRLLQRGAAPLPAREDERRTVLLVDDEPNIVASLQRLLRREGYRILTANSGAEALNILATRKVQVIVSDQRMPAMTGSEFLSRVRDLYPDTVRIMLSGYSDLATVTESVNKGAIYKFLHKPWDDQALRADIRDAFLYHEGA
ncbi:EAL domain-containing protein [Pseudoduganella flava]|uniref:EAL domain-containing protein n=1 Tax=Pseudoduganella flava TaxID=871742 RepID=UPI001303EF42|nr:EAL domain-containing protein [Pseudoduganella flava]